MVLRLGTVPYLNARPLVDGLQRDARVSLAQAVPSALAEQLRAGALDAALVSAVELFRAPRLRYVPGPAICSEGPVRSIRLFLRRPAERVRTLALDGSSLTAAVLAQLCLREFLGAGAPAVSSAAPEAPLASIDADAILRIGDPALATAPDGLQVLDLGEVWTAHTKLPFVYALWLVRPGVPEQPLTECLLAARERGLARLPEIAAEFAAESRGAPGAPDAAGSLDYLRHAIGYDLGEVEHEGLAFFGWLAHRYGLVHVPLLPEPLGAGAPSGMVR
jgi:chorismate dehydratase